jgi:cytoskeletal protein RodZ
MPPTLGQRLKYAREKRGLSLRDVQHTTRIPVARLQDLEEDKLNTFGGMTYAKCFLRTYATLLDVNADEVLEQMKPPPLGGARDYRYLVESHGPWIVDRSERYAGAYPSSLGPGKPFLLAVMVCVVLVVLVGGGLLASVMFNFKPASSPDTTKAVGAEEQQRYLTAGELEEPEFILQSVSVTVGPDNGVNSNGNSPADLPAPPKAQVVEDPAKPTPRVPKAIPVR